MIFIRIIVFIITFLNSGLLFSENIKSIANPYGDIRYHEAFEQDDIYKKYQELMYFLGCDQNIFYDKDEDKVSLRNKKFSHMKNQGYLFKNQLEIEIEKFQKDCLARLNQARFIALAEPGIQSGMYIGFGGLAALATIYLMGKDSAGGSYSGYSAIFSAAYELGGLGKSLYNLIFSPNNSLESLENYFAKNKCFIPRLLWPKIINAFIDARQTDALKEKSINFLKFSLGFTIYKTPIKDLFRSRQTIADIKNELNQRVDNFFKEYDIHSNVDSLIRIKINVSKFIDCLVDKKSKPSRYIYLHGLGGIGKTHFVQTLASWIEELLPGMVYYQDLVINSIVELEGDAQTPGAFLKVLRNQTMESKIGSIIMIDEATWLNDVEMVSAAKRIFNGDRTRLSTAYFGMDIDGSAVSLDMPPMLIFVASNDEMTDPALASRFDIIHYPMPSISTLVSHAYKISQNSTILHERSCVVMYEDIVAWLEAIEPENRNFRYIAGNVEAYCLSQKNNMQN